MDNWPVIGGGNRPVTGPAPKIRWVFLWPCSKLGKRYNEQNIEIRYYKLLNN